MLVMQRMLLNVVNATTAVETNSITDKSDIQNVSAEVHSTDASRGEETH